MSQTNHSAANTVIVQAPPSEVHIYLSQGMIKKQGTVFLKKGKNEIYIPELTSDRRGDVPSVLFDQEVNIESVQILPALPREVSGDEEDVQEELQEEISQLNREIKSKELMHSFLVKSADNIFALKDISFKEASEYLESLPDKLKKIDCELEALKKKLQEARAKATAKNTEQEKREIRIYQTPCLKVVVFSTAEIEAQITLEFIEKNAYWIPYYRISADEDRKNITVSLRGQISQTSGIDWEKVKLILSTGSPSRLLQKPKLRKISLSLRHSGMYGMSENTMNRYPAPSGISADLKMIDDIWEPDGDNSIQLSGPSSAFTQNTANVFQPVGVRTNDTTVDFVLPGTYDIPTGNTRTMVSIQELSIPVNFIYTVYPTASPDAILSAKFIENRHLNLPEGDADLFMDGVYIGKINVRPSSWQEQEELSFGPDRRIQVKREMTKSNHLNVRLSGNERTMYEYSYEYMNQKDNSVDVKIMDQVPVSSDKEVTVDITELSGGKLEDETGFITWEKGIGSGESGKFMLKYQITSPKGKYVWENM